MQAVKVGVNHFVVKYFKHYILQARHFLAYRQRAGRPKYDR